MCHVTSESNSGVPVGLQDRCMTGTTGEYWIASYLRIYPRCLLVEHTTTRIRADCHPAYNTTIYTSCLTFWELEVQTSQESHSLGCISKPVFSNNQGGTPNDRCDVGRTLSRHYLGTLFWRAHSPRRQDNRPFISPEGGVGSAACHT